MNRVQGVSMKKLLSNRFIPDHIVEKFSRLMEIKMPEQEKGAFSREEVLDLLPGFHGLLIDREKADAELIEAGKDLEVIANLAVGTDNVDFSAANQRGIAIINTPRAVTLPTAELTLGLIITAARGIVSLDKESRVTRSTVLPAFSTRATSLQGKTLGLIGFGRIGKEVARLAQAFGMNIVYHTRTRSDREAEQRLGVEYVGFEELLKRSDFVSLHCPYNQENYHMIDKDALSQMKRSAYLINAGRGPLVSEADLIEALEQGVIKGAALDVFENEPTISLEVTQVKNLVMVPHVGTWTFEARCNMADEALSGVHACFSGQIPENMVNKAIANQQPER